MATQRWYDQGLFELRLTGGNAGDHSDFLQRVRPANDNALDGPWPIVAFPEECLVVQEEPFACLRSAHDEITKPSGNVSKGLAINVTYVLSAVLATVAWFYLLGLTAMRATEWY